MDGLKLNKALLLLFVLPFSWYFPLESGNPESLECLGGIETFLYLGDEPYPGSHPIPLSPWKFEAFIGNSIYVDQSDVEIARFGESGTEIWILSAPDGFLSEPTEIVVYYPSIGEKTTISNQTNLEGVEVDRLFVDREGDIWARNRWVTPDRGTPPSSEFPVFSKYDEASRTFITVDSGPRTQVLGNPWQVLDTQLPQIGLESQSVFWVFLQEDGLYRFDSNTLQTSKVLGLPDFTILPLYVAPDGIIYFETFEYEFHVYKYSYSEDRLEEIALPVSGWFGAGSILVDQNLNLWLGGFGWRNAQGEWQILHPNANEMLMNWEDVRAPGRISPKIIYESSNGWLWFGKYTEFDNGIAWLNPDTGESCWFTTLSKSVIEDNEGRMWMTANGKLYSLDIYPGESKPTR